jgi:histidine kinase
MRQFGRKSDMSLAKVQINEVIQKAFEFFSQQLKLRAIDVLWEIDENLPMVMGDSDRLEQVFINLLINARDAIEEKCFSEDKMFDKCEKRIRFKTFFDADSVCVEVGDTGVGIPETQLHRIFEPFYTTKQVGKGTGLGLSISYGIVKDCGGEIRAVSGKDQGATFVITFPISDKESNKSWITQFYS